MKNKMMFLSVLAAISVVWTGVSLAEGNPNEVLRRADEARGNLEGVKWIVHIVSKENNRKQERRLEVKSKGYDFLAVYVAPPRVKNQQVLMVDHNMWFMKPGLRKPVPISPRQRLIGGAAYGDIAATNYADDYEVTILSEDMFGNEPCYLFDLKAVARNATYDRIKYWVSKERIVGVKAEFYTVSGKLFKSATFEYQNQIDFQNKTQPFISKMIIADQLLGENVTTMRFTDQEIADIPHATFDLNLLIMRY
jgi:outer membrane lipoprotein-sorting protein